MAIGAVLIVVVAACGQGASPSPSAASDQGGTLSIGFESDIQYSDPALAYDFVSWPANRLMFETLVTYDAGTTLVPALAAEMPRISDDGLVYTFKLRTGVQFVKAGGEVHREMTADDVVFSLNRLLRQDLLPNPSPVGGAFFSVIEGAEAVLDGSAETASGLRAVDASTVEITLSRPDRTFINVLAMQFGSVVPADLAGYDAAAFGAAPVGTGPYWRESYTAGESAVFQRSTSYWAPENAKADTIEFRLLVTIENQLRQVQANELDIMGDQIQPADFNAVTTDPAYADRLIRDPTVSVAYLTMDVSGEESPFTDVRVRQAVNHAIDKENQVRIQNGRAVVAGCIFPPNLPGHDPACDPYPYDLARAQALMAEAEVSGFSTELYTDTSDLSRLSAEAIATDLAKLGIDVEVITQDFDTLLGTIAVPHAAPMVLISWFQDFPDPSDFIDPILSCATAVEGGSNNSWYCNEDVDADAAAARQILDLQEAIPDYQDIERRIMADAPIVPILFPEWVILRSQRVPGFTGLHPVWYYQLHEYAIVE
jgi:ABC-type transport system substrate-binding protein